MHPSLVSAGGGPQPCARTAMHAPLLDDTPLYACRRRRRREATVVAAEPFQFELPAPPSAASAASAAAQAELRSTGRTLGEQNVLLARLFKPQQVCRRAPPTGRALHTPWSQPAAQLLTRPAAWVVTAQATAPRPNETARDARACSPAPHADVNA
jgi:hypothetical protein|eukprot:6345976-Prymnesium_polylepis.2